MKALLLLVISVSIAVASGGDTIKYTSDVKNLKDGDNFYSDIHYHPLKDSIAAIVNGRLGNINIANDAEIDLSKLDTAGVIRGDTLRNKKVNTDTVVADVATIDTSHTRHATADSATFTKIKGAKTISDTTTFAGGAYFAGIARFAGTLYAPTVDIDSMIGDVKIGGKALITGYVGIGTNNPLTNLHVVGGIATFNSSSIGFSAGSTGSSNDISLQNYANSAKTVNIKSDGPSYITGSLKVAACTTTTLNTDSIKINGGSYLNTFETGSFPCTLSTSYVTVEQTGTIYYQVVGGQVILRIPPLYGESNSTTLAIKFGSAPNVIKPSSTRYGTIGPVTGTTGGNTVETFFVTATGTTMNIGVGWNLTGTKGVISSPGSYVCVTYLK